MQTARYSHGPDVQQMLYGSEGNFGVITSVVVKVRTHDDDIIIRPGLAG